MGSLKPWLEGILLSYGATELTTVEYQETVTHDQRLHYIHPLLLAEQWTSKANSFDFAASFSSIEHSGLGRYGDALDPIGDLREMLKIRCLLKHGAIFYLGIPTGKDTIFWNANRVYGMIRLPLLMAGYEYVDSFHGRKGQNKLILGNGEVFGANNFVIVLRKNIV